MERDHPAAQPLVLERLAQRSRVHDRLAVIGESERAGVAELGHLGELLAFQASRDRGQEPDGYLCLPRGGFDQRSEDRGIVDDGVGVGHGDHRAEAAGRRGGRAGLEVLLVLLAGRAQVHVRVDEPGKRMHALGVDGVAVLGRLEGSGLAELGDVPVLDEDVVRLVEPGARIEHVGAGDQQLSGLGRSVEQALGIAHHATAARLGAPTSNS